MQIIVLCTLSLIWNWINYETTFSICQLFKYNKSLLRGFHLFFKICFGSHSFIIQKVLQEKLMKWEKLLRYSPNCSSGRHFSSRDFFQAKQIVSILLCKRKNVDECYCLLFFCNSFLSYFEFSCLIIYKHVNRFIVGQNLY